MLQTHVAKQEEEYKLRQKAATELNLSKYFPRGSIYFYSFPSGQDSNFFNTVPPWIEELVASRPLVCAGDNLKVLTFAASSSDEIRNFLEQDCGVRLLKKDRIITLPETVNSDLFETARNRRVKSELARLAESGNLIMAQPLLDENLDEVYQISPRLTVWLNDKKNMPVYIPAAFLPKRLAEFKNGQEFADAPVPSFPCVVKVSSSSTGDGVRLCRDLESYARSKQFLRNITGTIFIEEFVNFKRNYCVQFAIPHDKNLGIEIIGQNQQLISEDGAFMGATIDRNHHTEALTQIHKTMKDVVLPKIRSLGWYGVGGIDVLVDQDDKYYFIDSNFRMTASLAYVMQTRNGEIKKPVVGFTGYFTGDAQKFRNNVLARAQKNSGAQILEMLAITKRGGSYWFNAALLYDQTQSLPDNARDLLKLGVQSEVLSNLAAKPAESVL